MFVRYCCRYAPNLLQNTLKWGNATFLLPVLQHFQNMMIVFYLLFVRLLDVMPPVRCLVKILRVNLLLSRMCFFACRHPELQIGQSKWPF